VTRYGWRGPGWRVLDACPGHVEQVRHWIQRVVAASGCRADPGDAALAVSELFTNALVHGPPGGRVLVGYCLWPGGARIVVCDAGADTAPCLRDPDGLGLGEGGRGLHVVAAISARWDSFRAGQARVVWCDLGQSFPAAAGDAWAWLAPLLATNALAPATWPAGRQRAAAVWLPVGSHSDLPGLARRRALPVPGASLRDSRR
jgi:anti-sigma regulatory factor (Ser/Thr protein kinase)